MRTRFSTLARVAVLTVVLPMMTAACGDDTPAAGPESVSVSQSSRIPGVATTSDLAARAVGLSRIPHVKNPERSAAIQRRHYPPALLARGIGGSALVDVSLDERGAVRDVRPVAIPAETSGSDVRHRAAIRKRVPGSNRVVEREIDLNYDNAAFGAAARATVRDWQYEPAMRDGRPVPFTFRMTVSFTPALAKL